MKELFKYKELIYELALRDLRLRYRKPFLGFFWMLLIPFSTAFIYKVLFSDFMRVTNAGYPFFIYLITAVLPWSYFASSLQGATRCILNSKHIINQISFPKYLLPISTIFANLMNFLPSLFVLLIFILAFKIKLTALVIFLPLVILIQTCIIIGLSLAASALQVVYRDTEYILDIALMALFFLTPGVYTLGEVINRVSPALLKIYLLNPFVGLCNMYRIAFIGGYLENLPKEANFLNIVIIPVLCSVIFLFGGYCVFTKYEKKFSDFLNI